VREVAEQAPAGGKPHLSIAVDRTASNLNADPIAFEIKQWPRQSRFAAIDIETGRYAQNIAGWWPSARRYKCHESWRHKPSRQGPARKEPLGTRRL
jgi:hypothetical protein